MTDDRRSQPLEYALGALGGLLVLGALVLLGYQGIAVRDGGPELTASVARVDSAAGQHVVHYEVRNAGGETAESVRVVGELVQDGKTVETVSSTVAYVPVGSSRSRALVFQHDPSTGTLQVRAASYTTP
jgi:uncharacterized protein (TIGR02588 family)